MATTQQSEIKVTERPVFVLGAPRSGTSMMQWALRQHPDLWGGQESDFIVPLVEDLTKVHDFGSRRGDLHWLSGQGVDLAEFLRYMGIGLNALYTNRAGGLRWVEQTPQYTLHMDQILSLFPGAVFVMMLRDGRDVVESLKHFVNPVGHVEAARLWDRFVTAGLDFADGPDGDRAQLVRYRDAVLDTERTMSAVFAFLDLPESPEAVSWIRDRSPINSSFRSSEASQSLGRWTGWSQTERRQFNDVAGGSLLRAGFEDDDDWVQV